MLKFFMSILIVAIHTRAFYGEWASIYLKPITDVAVPVFFILSSFFYFRKIHINGFSWSALWHFLSRIGLLYLFWFLVKLPIILHQQQYFISGGLVDGIRLLKDVVFRATFSGSWFLSALALSVFIFSLAYKCKSLLIIIISLSLLLLFYINCIDIIPDRFHDFYDWWKTNIRDEVKLTLLEALPWVGMGCVLSSSKMMRFAMGLNRIATSIITAGVLIALALYVITVDVKLVVVSTMLLLIVSITLVILAGASNLENSKKLTHLRNLSILFYMFHFICINVSNIIYSNFHISICGVVGYFSFFLIVLFFTFISSEIFLWLSTKKYFKWLKYGY